MKPIHAVILDGFHKGHVVRLPYAPVIRLLKPKITHIETCCEPYLGDSNTDPSQEIDYKVCFTAVDGDVAFYSLEGKSIDFLTKFPVEATDKPFTRQTHLKYGYDGEYLGRDEEELAPHY